MESFVKGHTYKTVGGWNAEIVYVLAFADFYAIHHPENGALAHLVYHLSDGKSKSAFSVYEPPTYDMPHPADLTHEEHEEIVTCLTD